MKSLLKVIEKAKAMSATEFTELLDTKAIPWIWDDCDNILDYNEGRCVINIIPTDYNVWFEDGEFVDISK